MTGGAAIMRGRADTVFIASETAEYTHESIRELSPEGREYRQGYFFGDGTRVGKGRQIATCILDQWLAGNRRAIWTSKNEALLEDAGGDWAVLGSVKPMCGR